MLDSSTHEALTRLAGGYLDAAARALARLEDPGDARALHAFRVAIRRLRSLLRTYRSRVGRLGGRKVRRRLRDLTRDTNPGRDAEVQIDWLSTQRTKLAPEEQAGFSWLLRRLAGRKRLAYRSARAELGRDFAGVVELLRKRMAKEDSPGPEPFRQAFVEPLGPAVAEFRRRLTAISGAGDVNAIHRARVQVKRLRYLVEPLRTELAQARAALIPLKELQKLLGELHDLHVLDDVLAAAIEEAAAENARRLHELAVRGEGKALVRARRRDERLGLLALATSAWERRDTVYALLEQKWILGRKPALTREFGALEKRVNAMHTPAVKSR